MDFANIYIIYNFNFIMDKRGFSVGILLITISVLLIIAVVLVFFFFGGESEEEIIDIGEAIGENQEGSLLNETINESGVGLALEMNGTNNETINEDVEPEPLFFDLAAINLTLTDNGCENITNSTSNVTTKNCSIGIVGVLKNLGGTIEEKFVVQFIDITEDSSPIEIFIIKDGIGSKEEKELSATYSSLSSGTYWVQFKVDAVKNIDEEDETNNEITKAVSI